MSLCCHRDLKGLGFLWLKLKVLGFRALTPNFEFLPYDINVWADRIVEIAGNPCTRGDMSKEIAKAGFSIKEQIKVIEDVYNKKI
jgi:hypothetical protein